MGGCSGCECPNGCGEDQDDGEAAEARLRQILEAEDEE